MRKILLIAVILFLHRPLFTQYAVTNSPGFGTPDVMGFVNTLETDINGNHYPKIMNIDSFPTFNGYPKNVSGESFEGGIYCQMDNDSALEIVYGVGNFVYAWKLDGSNVPGWPVSLSYTAEGAPAFGDIDGDGQPDIVINSRNFTSTAGAIYAFHKNGTPVTGFPIVNGAPTRTVVLADLDNNGRMEIITNKRLSGSGEISVYKGDGTIYPGWPKTIDHVPASSAAVGDITGDGVPEIIGESYNSLYAFDKNGNVLPGFPYTMPGGEKNSYSSPVLVDLNGDGTREIIFGTHNTTTGAGKIFILDHTGAVLTNWPKQTSEWVYGPVTPGYIDGDNVLDILVGDQVGSGTPADYIYGWNKDGTVLTGFPIGPIFAVNNQISVGDIDGDNQYELIVDDNSADGQGRGKYLAFNTDGTAVSGWPQYTLGATFYNMPCLADLNRDGHLDIVGASFSTPTSNVYIWNTGINYNLSKIINPMWQFNTRHNGVWGDNELTGIKQISNELPRQFNLQQNYPNPFNPSTKIRFAIPSGMSNTLVKLIVYDILGREVATLVNSNLNPGNYEVNWDGSNYSSGVYFYKLQAADFSEIKKMSLVK